MHSSRLSYALERFGAPPFALLCIISTKHLRRHNFRLQKSKQQTSNSAPQLLHPIQYLAPLISYGQFAGRFSGQHGLFPLNFAPRDPNLGCVGCARTLQDHRWRIVRRVAECRGHWRQQCRSGHQRQTSADGLPESALTTQKSLPNIRTSCFVQQPRDASPFASRSQHLCSIHYSFRLQATISACTKIGRRKTQEVRARRRQISASPTPPVHSEPLTFSIRSLRPLCRIGVHSYPK